MSAFRRRSTIPRNDSVRLETKDENGNTTTTIVIRTFSGTCCGCCDMFVGIKVMCAWNLFASLFFWTFGGFVISGYYMPDDNDKDTLRIVLGMLIIPGCVRFGYSLVGIFFMVRKLKELIVLDEAYKRPDDYNDYECCVNVWNWLLLWTPISTDFLLSFGILAYIMDTSSQDTEYWDPTFNTARDAGLVIGWTILLFFPAIIDSVISMYFYHIFRGFVEETFKNRLYACNCSFCPAKCKVCHPPYC